MSQKSICPPPMDSCTDVGTLPTRERVLTSFLKPPEWQFKDSHKLPQLHTVKADLWILPLLIKPTQGCQKMWLFSGMLNGLVGLPKLQFIPYAPVHTKRLWSLPLQYRVWVDPGRWATWLAHKQLKQNWLKVPKITLGPYSGTNTLPCMVVVSLLEKHQDSHWSGSAASHKM